MGRHEEPEPTEEQLEAIAEDFDAAQADIDARSAAKPSDYPAIRNHEAKERKR